ncbi:MAG: type I glyceraldehyde-3-phosphate dehydrogenase [Chitinophagales bacterium]|nr:type I glyceraldehyde-3-phosphate dehydrogenase [Chitinophagales bacterium]
MKIAINGFGRIGRLTFRNLFDRKDVEIVALNDLADSDKLAHLLKYDSAHRTYQKDISFDENHIIVDGKSIPLYKEREATNLPWKKLGVDVVAECSGHYRTKEKAMQHVEAGAKRVVISAPATRDIKTIVLGVNDKDIKAEDVIISNASCTTNCLAPMAKLMHENFEIEKGYINTVHAYTADQMLQDAPHKDLRRARAAANSIIPTSTGAAKAVGWVIPALEGKLDGIATRVPVITGSLTDFTFIVKKNATVEAIQSIFKKAAEKEMKGILKYTEDPLVSSDIVSSHYSCVFQGDLISINENMVKLIAWYDNEMGYATRMADLLQKLK